MYSDYFVMITDDFFGVFDMIAPHTIPEDFPNELSYICKVPRGDIEKYLIEHIGVNLLINKEFKIPISLNKLYSRQPS